MVSDRNQEKWHKIRSSGFKANSDGKVWSTEAFVRGYLWFFFYTTDDGRSQPRGGVVIIPCTGFLITPGNIGRFMFLNQKGVLSGITELPNCFVLTA